MAVRLTVVTGWVVLEVVVSVCGVVVVRVDVLSGVVRLSVVVEVIMISVDVGSSIEVDMAAYVVSLFASVVVSSFSSSSEVMLEVSNSVDGTAPSVVTETSAVPGRV